MCAASSYNALPPFTFHDRFFQPGLHRNDAGHAAEKMFHAVNQIPSEDIGSPGSGALPMFREQPSSSGRGSSSSGGSRSRRSTNGPRRTQQVGGGSGGSGSTLSGSVVADAAAAGGDILAGAAPVALEMRPLHLATRRRRSGHLKEMSGGRPAGAPATAVLSSNNASPVAFAGPDGLDTGSFAEAGTFRWDAAVADAATAQQDEMAGEGALEEDEGGGDGGGGGDSRRSGGLDGGGGSSRRGGGMGVRRSGKLAVAPPLLLSGEMTEMALATRYPRPKPWYIITPESKTHQIFDHLGERGVVSLLESRRRALCAE